MRLIDADEVSRIWCKGCAACQKDIDKIPTVEPKCGKWVWDCDKEGWKCSECHTLIHDIFIFEDDDFEDPEINFCMNCGADMRGKDNEIG